MAEPRIVTLLASATEIVCALGFEDALVARSHECDYPATVDGLPVCTSSKIDTARSSRAIDDQVKAIVEQGLSVYQVDGDFLQALKPEVIVTQTQCEVCAVTPQDLDRAVREWTDGAPAIVSLEPNALADVWTDIANVAGVLDAAARGERLVAELRGRHGGDRGGGGRCRRTSACRLHRVDRSADGCRQLDARAGGDGGRHQSVRRGRQAFAMDDLGGAGCRRSGYRRGAAVRL